MIDLLIDAIIIFLIVLFFIYGYKKGAFMICAGVFCKVACITLSLAMCKALADVLVSPIISRMIIGNLYILSIFVKPLSVIISFFAIKFLLKRAFSLLTLVLNFVVGKGVLGAVNKIFGVVISISCAFAISYVFVNLTDYVLVNQGLFEDKNNIIFNGGPIYRFLISFRPTWGT